MSRLLLCVALLLLALVPRPASAQSAADVAAARELFIEGAALAKAGQWDQARDRYERSLALKHAAITLYSLGVAQMSTQALVEALESFRAFVREPASATSEPYRQPAADAIGELEQRVGRLTILIPPAQIDGLDVVLDGASVPPAALGRPRLVNPGSHALSATAPGYLQQTSQVTVAEGGSEQITITLTPQPRAPTPAQREPQPAGPQPAPSADFPVLPVVLMGGGAALLGVAIAVGVAGLNQAQDAPASEGDEADGARTKAIVADLLGGAGIVAVGVGVVLLLLDQADGTPKPGAVGLWTADGLGGLQLSF
jgi:hypothetical protein